MAGYKIDNKGFIFDINDLFTDYAKISVFPIRPNKIIRFQYIKIQYYFFT